MQPKYKIGDYIKCKCGVCEDDRVEGIIVCNDDDDYKDEFYKTNSRSGWGEYIKFTNAVLVKPKDSEEYDELFV